MRDGRHFGLLTVAKGTVCCLLVAGGIVVSQIQGAEDGISLSWSMPIPMRDGVKLHASLYKPTNSTTPLPVIFTLTPYIADGYHDRSVYFAKHGYAFATVDVRGRGNSEGEFIPFENDAQDGYDIVEWLARQSWCNGKVAMWGGSYAGFNQWATLKELPPHLVTIVPAAAAHPGIDFPVTNGIFSPYMIRWLTGVSGKTDNRKLFGDSDFWNQHYLKRYLEHSPFENLGTLVGNPSPHFKTWIAHRTDDSYWGKMTPSASQYTQIQIPILSITGQYDSDQRGALTYYKRHLSNASGSVAKKHFLIIGPWDHPGTRTPAEEFHGLKFGKASLVDLNQLHKEWYDWTMKEGTRPTFLEKRVSYYVAGAERWKYGDTLDIATGHSTYYLSAQPGTGNDVFHSGTLTPDKPMKLPSATFLYDPLDVRPAEFEKEEVAGGLTDQRPAYDLFGSALIYHSKPFDRDTEITGIPKLVVWLTADVADTDVEATLYEIKPDGSSIALGYDFQRIRYRKSLASEQLLKSGEPVKLEFSSFNFFSRQLVKGSRLRLLFGARNSIAIEKNYNSGKDVARETKADAKVAHVSLLQDEDHASYLQIPVVPAD